MTDKMICLYHANCTDGAAAAAVVKYKYPEAACYPMNHGQPLPVSVRQKVVFIVDFSFNFDTMSEVSQQAEAVYWYDHHQTALDTQKKLGWGIVDLQESGASLTWKQEFPDRALPKILAYVRDKDLYTWQLPHSRALSAELHQTEGILDPASESWRQLLTRFGEADFQKMVKRGEAGLHYQRHTVLQGAKNGFEVDFHGHRAFAVNWSLEASTLGEYIYKELGYEVAILFYYNGAEWKFSLRSDKVDVSQLALRHGGGGHPGAAGFRSQNLDGVWTTK